MRAGAVIAVLAFNRLARRNREARFYGHAVAVRGENVCLAAPRFVSNDDSAFVFLPHDCWPAESYP